MRYCNFATFDLTAWDDVSVLGDAHSEYVDDREDETSFFAFAYTVFTLYRFYVNWCYDYMGNEDVDDEDDNDDDVVSLLWLLSS